MHARALVPAAKQSVAGSLFANEQAALFDFTRCKEQVVFR
jgi:hypothetical protein